MEYLDALQKRLDTLIGDLRDEFLTIRTNRPTPKLIEDIPVEYAGSMLSVKQLGSIGVEQPRSIIVTPWDQAAAPAIAKAIESENIGTTVAVQGNIVRVTLPELTNERREELTRIVKTTAEKTRIKMRTLRDEAHKKANDEPDEDDKFRAKEELQKIVDEFNVRVDELLENKIKEISE